MSGHKHDAQTPKEKMKRTHYEKELRKLQAELCHLQEWVKQTGQRIIVVFEGRDAAGKGAPSTPLLNASARGSFARSLCPLPPTAKSLKCISSVTSNISPRLGKSSFSTAVGTTGLEWNT